MQYKAGTHAQEVVPVVDGWNVRVSCWGPARQRCDVDCLEGALLVVSAANDVDRGAQLGQQWWGCKGVGGLAIGLKGNQRWWVVSLCRALKESACSR